MLLSTLKLLCPECPTTRAPKGALGGAQFSVPVRACHLAEDGRALVATLTQGFFLRYELDLLRPARDKSSFEDASEDESDDQAGMQPPGVSGTCHRPAWLFARVVERILGLPELESSGPGGLYQAVPRMGGSCLQHPAYCHGRD